MLLTPRAGTQHTFISNIKKARGCYAGKSQERRKLIETLGGKKYFSPDSSQKDMVGLAPGALEGEAQSLPLEF